MSPCVVTSGPSATKRRVCSTLRWRSPAVGGAPWGPCPRLHRQGPPCPLDKLHHLCKLMIETLSRHSHTEKDTFIGV